MYVVITTRCNLHCDHCCGDYTDIGEDMSLDTFQRVCELAEARGEGIFIGGGEPTLHPLFLQFLAMAILYSDNEYGCGMITNGTNEELTRRLIHAKTEHVLGEGFFLAVSQGELHGYLDYDIPEEYIREDPTTVVRMGRAVKMWDHYGWEESRYCICEGLHVRVNGDIHFCGCSDSPKLCSVYDRPEGREVLDYVHYVGCYKDGSEDQEWKRYLEEREANVS